MYLLVAVNLGPHKYRYPGLMAVKPVNTDLENLCLHPLVYSWHKICVRVW